MVAIDLSGCGGRLTILIPAEVGNDMGKVGRHVHAFFRSDGHYLAGDIMAFPGVVEAAPGLFSRVISMANLTRRVHNGDTLFFEHGAFHRLIKCP